VYFLTNHLRRVEYVPGYIAGVWTRSGLDLQIINVLHSVHGTSMCRFCS